MEKEIQNSSLGLNKEIRNVKLLKKLVSENGNILTEGNDILNEGEAFL